MLTEAPAALEPGLATTTDARRAAAGAGLARAEPVALGGEAPLEEVPARIVRTAEAGGRQLQIRLQPAELGRLDIRLDFDGEQGVRVHIRADNEPALELLQRQGHTLERALQQSGFELGRDAIRYDLDPSGGRSARGGDASAGDGDGHRAGRGQGDGEPGHGERAADDAGADAANPPAPFGPGVPLRNVLDLHV